MLKDKFKFDLQLFADGEEQLNGDEGKQSDSEETLDDKDTGTHTDDNNAGKTFTQKELDEIIQQRLARQETKIKEEFAKEQAKAARLKDLSDDEKEKEELKIKREELEEKERAIAAKELEIDTIERLTDEGLPLTFKDFLIKEDADSTNDSIKLFKEEWHKALQEEINKKIQTKEFTVNKGRSNVSLGSKLAKVDSKTKKHDFF